MSALVFFSILAGCIAAGLIEALIEHRMEAKFDAESAEAQPVQDS